MVSKFSLVNSTINKELVFTEDGTTNFAIEEVDWGTVSADHTTYKSLNQIGSDITSTNLQERTITITGWLYAISDINIISAMSEDELKVYRETEIAKYQNLLSKTINPQHVVDIYVGDFTISGKPTESPTFGNTYSDNNEIKCKFQFSIFCNKPMFSAKKTTETILSGKTNGFHFPLVIKETTGIIMGVRKSYQLVPVNNEGDIETGGIITLKANGLVYSPTLTNIYTGEVIKIHGELHAGDKIIINTEDTRKSIVKEVDGVQTSYFDSWDLSNSWMQFPVGSSLVGFTAVDGTYNLLDVTIELKAKQYSFGGM